MTNELEDWTTRPLPGASALEGRTVRLEPVRDERHFADLFEAFAADRSGTLWAYLAYGPFESEAGFRAFARKAYLADGIVFYAIIPNETGRAAGVGALMRTDAANGVTEIGHLCFGPALQGTIASSEAQYLWMRHVFDDLGYRRYEWKCDNANQPSKRAAGRLGFTFEGLFRQHMVVKGRNRDTAWLSIIDAEWPPVAAAFEAWLDPANFDGAGRQRRSLEEIRRSAP